MKIKTGFFNKKLVKNYFAFLSILSVLISFIFIIVDVEENSKGIVSASLGGCLVTIYIVLWFRANMVLEANLNINNSNLSVKIGNIFDEPELKVIAFNEYFDTKVDNVIISDKTLNGIYIKDFVQDVEAFDNQINNDKILRKKIVESNCSREEGKKDKYILGTICKHDEYLLTAFSKFDEDNRAYLSISEYINFLFNFWNEVDIVYGGKSVAIPLLGTGITRLKDYNMVSEQELLEIMIWSFKVSRIKFTHPSKVSIVINESKKDKINFYKLRSVYNGV